MISLDHGHTAKTFADTTTELQYKANTWHFNRSKELAKVV